MKIENIQIKSPTRKTQKKSIVEKVKIAILSKGCDFKLQPITSDVIELSPEAKIEQHAKRIFSCSRKFDIDDYNNLSSLEKSVLRQASKQYQKAANDSLRVGLKVKEKLDKYHEKDGYVFCSIGTSPSGIARVLEFMGVETKYLPISRLNWLDSVDDWIKYKDKFSQYSEFLKEQGLSKEMVSSSNKKYLFYDYVQQGMSIIVFEKMMREYFGLDLPNVSFNNLNYLCYSSCAEKIDPPQYSIDYVEEYMNGSKIAEIGGVPHLDIAEIDKIDECKNFENIKAKMFNFLLIDELSKLNRLKKNSLNDTSL